MAITSVNGVSLTPEYASLPSGVFPAGPFFTTVLPLSEI